MNLFSIFRKKKAPEPEHRTAIKSQKDPNELFLTPTEQTIADRFERLPRACRRVIERQEPKSWTDLMRFTEEHRDTPHHHG